MSAWLNWATFSPRPSKATNQIAFLRCPSHTRCPDLPAIAIRAAWVQDHNKKHPVPPSDSESVLCLSVSMPRTPKGHKRPADAIGNAVTVMKIATGEIEESVQTDDGKSKAAVELGRKGGESARHQTSRPASGMQSPRKPPPRAGARGVRRFRPLGLSDLKKQKRAVHLEGFPPAQK